MIGSGAIVLWVLGLTWKGKLKWLVRILSIAAVVFLGARMLQTGSRAPLLALGVAMVLVVLLVAGRSNRLRSAFIFSGSLLSVMALWRLIQSDAVDLESRSVAWLSGERDTSTQARQFLWEQGLLAARHNPLGLGWGGFTDLPFISDYYRYPHNFAIELILEAGWIIGGFVLLVLLSSGFRLWFLAGSSSLVLSTFSLFVFSVINAMFSGDINDNRLLWITAAAAWGIAVGGRSRSAGRMVSCNSSNRLKSPLRTNAQGCVLTSRRM
ncbi:O-antigen ligase family protein [Micrococcus luteus]